VRNLRTRPKRWLALAAVAAVLAIACGGDGAALAAPRLKVIYTFKNVRGVDPTSSLIADAAGNLYGTTLFGGRFGKGVVFALSPPVAGKSAWTGNVLHDFDGADGALPNGGLIVDSAGALYGTTSAGGADGFGVVFKLTPPANGKTVWAEKVLTSFPETVGLAPSSGVIADSAGNLYGTAAPARCCGAGLGRVFELSPPVAGQTAWTLTDLFSFAGLDGAVPAGSLIADHAGNLYGTTVSGGPANYGVVYELSPPAAGQTAWTHTVLHFFDNRDGVNPSAGLFMDSAGNIYGMTPYGGSHGDGVVYELSPPVAGQTAWAHKVLHYFDNTDGDRPYGSLMADGLGNLYGTTEAGGADGLGVVFELSPPVAGRTHWTEKVLHAFTGLEGDPYGNLLADEAGNFYGTTWGGGPHYDGVVFKLTQR
jgi:uncharacterized repeat protein (TIGR03803 family)